ncbi:MAG: putative DNA binding domain-containing protein [Acidimicrobiaceae bacterium]|nr:putative DNA binding domain-containing protein [Acidimicrobiaceae bacterium]MDE0496278.1 putative DNA binding domain-containing protein [Acidimicrobiaceae bacterium]
MQWTDILNRIAAGEDQFTEFKPHFRDRDKVGKTICAFANTDGGLVVLGVSDSRHVIGVTEDSEQVQERLTSFLQTGCSSPVSARLGRHEDPLGWVHWIEVPRLRGFEPMRYDGRVWVRRGRSSVEPSPSELQDLYNLFGYILTEERTIEAATSGDIDLGAFRAYLRQLGIETEEEPQPHADDDLRNRSVLVDVGGQLRPTLYGVLAFGTEPQRYPQTANFRIECAAYAGADRAAPPLVVSGATGRLDEQLTRALAWFQTLGRFETYSELLRTDRYLLPIEALREALTNAVAHRDYAITGSKIQLDVFEDRAELTSPGSLPNHMTPDSVRAGGSARSRNESIANYLLTMRFMEQRARGWPLMRAAMREFNGSEPELDHDADARFVRVTFRLGGASQ